MRELEERLIAEKARDQEFVGLKMELALLQEQREMLALKLRKAEKLLAAISSQHPVRVSKKGNQISVS